MKLTTPDDEKRFRQEIARITESDSGRIVLGALMEQCGYQKPSIVANPQTGEINPIATTYNEGRRNLWLWLRKYVPHDKLALIELAEPRTVPPVDDLGV